MVSRYLICFFTHLSIHFLTVRVGNCVISKTTAPPFFVNWSHMGKHPLISLARYLGAFYTIVLVQLAFFVLIIPQSSSLFWVPWDLKQARL